MRFIQRAPVTPVAACRPLVMGVLNVTPDSFSDGGRWLDHDAAVAHGLALVAEGADVVDVGGESTRPGAEPVDRRRGAAAGSCPVVEALAPHVRVSASTPATPAVAEAALAAGATLRQRRVGVAARGGRRRAASGWVAMHMQGDPRTMQDDPRYDDVVAEVRAFLVERAEAAVAAGVDGGVDRPRHRLRQDRWRTTSRCSAHLDELVATGFPVVVGTSRKGFLGTARSDGRRRCDDRLEGSVATATWAMWQGARMVRVHDVRATVHAAQVVAGEIVKAPRRPEMAADEGQVGPGHQAPQLRLGHQGPARRVRAARRLRRRTTARCAARRRSSGSASRASPRSSR